MLPDGQWKWHGGLASSDNTKIIGFPNNAGELHFKDIYIHLHNIECSYAQFVSSVIAQDSILVIDVLKQNVYLVGDDSILKSGTHRVPRDGRYKYLGGALTSDSHFAYLFPW